jgi:hypothetical protein
MIHVVLGMHKSGTTLVSELLHHAGIDMVDAADTATGYDDGNKWERDSTKQVNHAILGSAGAYSLETVGYQRRFGPAEQGRMRDVIAACSARHPDWGFKDPRTCLTYDLWAGELPPHRIIAVFRRPEEAWAHYWASTAGRRRLTVFRHCLARWCDSNVAILAALDRTSLPFIVIDYARLMTEPAEYARLERFVGRPLIDRRDPRMRRSRATRSVGYRLARAWHRLRGGASPEAITAGLDALRTG